MTLTEMQAYANQLVDELTSDAQSRIHRDMIAMSPAQINIIVQWVREIMRARQIRASIEVYYGYPDEDSVTLMAWKHIRQAH